MTVAVPAATPVKVTEQLPAVDNIQLAPTVPTALLDDVKVTIPVGVLVGVVVSVTVPLQLVVPPGTIVGGAVPQATLVDVLSLAT